MDKKSLFETLAAQVTQGELVFSTGAQVALKLRRALDDPDCHINTAARLIQAEPLLSARVIAIANSVVYNRSGREIADVHMAVSLLGFSTIRSLAMALVTRQMAGKSKNPALQELVNKQWEHSAHVASLAHAIARHVTHQDPETALFAGIIHEIGGFYMLSRVEEFPGLLEGDFTEWLEGGEVVVGRAVLGKLKVPASVTSIIETFWDGFLAMPPVTLADTLLLAEQLSPIPSPLHRLDNKVPESSMIASIEMVIGEETLSLILKESAEEIESLTRALQF
ncbi:MAG: HDOD domain-containing protein [Sideroxyarcus sp.]|nr:HDOD domain-containing protein [Sideroxyarcus sp.]